jgi:transcriptional regulator with XRE-family HTH domain
VQGKEDFTCAIRTYIVELVTADQLRRLRRRLGLTQASLAELVGVPANTIARWERGEMEMRPSMDRLVRLSVEAATSVGRVDGKVDEIARPKSKRDTRKR